MSADLAEVRRLSDACRTGRRDSFDAFRELVQFLFNMTVGAAGSSVRLLRRRDDSTKAGLVGYRGPDDPVSLTDGRYLLVQYILALEPSVDMPAVLKVTNSLIQYQASDNRDDWVWRYDYLKAPQDHHPPAHFQIRGTTTSQVPMHYHELERVHFPTGRVTLEGAIRCLIEQFDVPTNTDRLHWRPVLAESERLFLEHAIHPLSGPASLSLQESEEAGAP